MAKNDVEMDVVKIAIELDDKWLIVFNLAIFDLS